MSHFELEPFGRAPDGHEGFPNSYRVYDTFRGRTLIGTVIYMTELKVFRSASVYAPAADIREAFGGSIQDTETWRGDVSYKDTSPIEEARKLYQLYRTRLNWKERIARTFDIWWPACVGLWAIPEAALAIIEIISN